MKSVTGRWIVWALALATSATGAYVSWNLTVNHNSVPKAKKAAKAAAATQPAAMQTAAAKDAEDNLLDRMCSKFTWSDCDEAAESAWAVFPPGSPNAWAPKPWVRTSSLGLMYFIGMICWLLIVGWPSPSRWWAQMIPLLATGAGLGICIQLEYFMWTQLSHACPQCMITHGATLLLFVLLIMLWPRASEDEAAEVDTGTPQSPEAVGVKPQPTVADLRPWPTLWILAALPVVVVGAVTPMVNLAETLGGAIIIPRDEADAKMRKSGIGGATSQPAELAWATKMLKQYSTHYETHPEFAYTDWELAPKLDIPIAGRPTKGPADARHTVVLFSDFECPACRGLYEHFKSKVEPMFMNPATGGVRVVFKHWPLCTDCNPFAESNKHPSACEAAYAAEAAFVVGGDAAFWRMHDLLFANQNEWKVSRDFAKLARTVGLNVQAFTAAMKSDAVHNRVKADINDGINLGQDLVKKGQLTVDVGDLQRVDSTPNVYVDGKKLHIWPFQRAWQRILTASAAETQATDQTAQMALLEQRLNKASEELQATRKRYGYLNADLPAHAYLAWQMSPALNIPVQGRPARGPENARHTVVAFIDFEDPNARMFEVWLAQAIFPKGADPAVGGIRIIFKQWPMDGDNNPYAKASGSHPLAWKAACAAEAAYVLGGDMGFLKMHDALVLRQDEWKKSQDFAGLAQQVGLDAAQFTQTMNSEQVQTRVKADIEEGAALGKDLVGQGVIKEDRREWIKVDGAPSVFVDGKRLYLFGQIATWDKILGYVPKPRGGPMTTMPAVPATRPGQ